ncbi:TPA: ATP-binding protein, partial [Listeria monocytogenes]
GSGLGLAIVQQLIQKMDGSISVQSEPNDGSIFFITLQTTS